VFLGEGSDSRDYECSHVCHGGQRYLLILILSHFLILVFQFDAVILTRYKSCEKCVRAKVQDVIHFGWYVVLCSLEVPSCYIDYIASR